MAAFRAHIKPLENKLASANKILISRAFHGSGQISRVTRPVRISRRLDPTRPARISRRLDPTRPDPREYENLLTRPDPTREILKTS